MLDPLTTFSLASAIVQFVDFGSKVARGAIEIYNSADGTLEENVELEDSTAKIKQLNERILSHPIVKAAGGEISENEALLGDLASRSNVVAGELLSLLENFRKCPPLRPTQKMGKLLQGCFGSDALEQRQNPTS